MLAKAFLLFALAKNTNSILLIYQNISLWNWELLETIADKMYSFKH
jgi:hypothetical protein